MQSMVTELRVEDMAAEVDQIDGFWRDGSGAYMAIRPCHGIPGWLRERCPTLMSALAEIAGIRGQDVLHVMINRLEPGTTVPFHTDTLAPTRQGERPRVERWHLPLRTNGAAAYGSGLLVTHMALGSWWGPVRYWERHAVWNAGETDRVHLVVDLDTPERVL